MFVICNQFFVLYYIMNATPTQTPIIPTEGVSSKETNDNDNNVLSGDNKVDVDIEPDVKDNLTRIQVCACTFILNCFTNNSVAKN